MSNSYSLAEKDGLVRNADGVELGTFHEETQYFEFRSKEFQRYKAQVSRFLKAAGVPVTSWGVSGEIPQDKSEIPPRPKMDRRLGDKTPALVVWLEKFAPDEFKERYKVKRRGTVPRYIIADGRRVLDRYDEVWIAERKTCRTEIVSVPKGEDPDDYES